MSLRHTGTKLFEACQMVQSAIRTAHVATQQNTNAWQRCHKRQNRKCCLRHVWHRSAHLQEDSLIDSPEKEMIPQDNPRTFEPMPFSEFDESIISKFKVETISAPINSNSFADFMNFSKTLQSLVMMGVQLFKIEQHHPDAIKYLVNLDLNRDIKPKLELLHRKGVLIDEFGPLLTKNPKVLDPDLSIEEIQENLQYFADKGFSKDEITSLMLRCPVILTIPLANLDGILGFFQKLQTNAGRKITFSNSELRTLIVRCPSLITSNLYAVFEQIRTLERSCEFTLSQIRSLITDFPDILIKDAKQLELLYKFYVREMKYSNEELVRFPKAFGQRVKNVMERHYYLRHLGRDQYKCDQPRYISLVDVVIGADEIFCKNLKLGSVKDFKCFIKTL